MRVIKMDITEVIELMSMVDSMENIEEVTVTLGDNPSVTIKKRTTNQVAMPEAVSNQPPLQGFETAQTFAPQTASNLATPSQVKFAIDLVNKLGNGNTTSVVNGLAHALELPSEDILHPDEWPTQMTRDHASLYIDILEAQHKKMQKGAWG